MDKTLSLDQIENDTWPAPEPDDTYLVTTVRELRRKPVGTLTAEDLRIMIGQQVGLDILIPLALQALEENPLSGGDMYDGDLLVAVLRVPQSYWTANPMRHTKIISIIERVKRMIELDDDLSTPMKPVEEAIQKFG